ncbi:TraI/MobA(P) family conjugative relaxase [Janthinobacterium sp. YR213]|uniref:TraI/MobA(P) family conjugative relaxase n=1 Tax=Janthinobacterium sp. YR213 TaxID=1881027 RepID=UPI00087EB8FF|nr:TraI/MobA(P) family conjugative relaxase [Janthinobacterium sp. YR213]SDG75579.1 Relaxase/Mobilisation nuclease domain-containing protein [Janthinobacterium sp. YR213]
MIAKHVPMKVARKSGFASLLAYLADAQAKRERVGCVTVTNCQSDQPAVAVTEILNTQAQNQRALSDKTYHLILSFPAGEEPPPAVLQAVEARICHGLGYGAHQRISVVHHDTDNLHVHIAINKIHPSRYTIHQPYRDHATLGLLCAALEDEFGLQRDNHQARQTGAASRAMDMERHAGIESLLGLVRRACHAQMRDAASWQELHGVLLAHGLALRERGNGLVILADDGTAVKASSVHRDCSRARLEARLGPFTPGPAGTGGHPSQAGQIRQPLRLRVATAALYALYQEQQQDAVQVRAGALPGARAQHQRLIAEAKRRGRLKRAAIRMLACGPFAKRILYAAAAKTLMADIERINSGYLAERRVIRSQHGRLAWADWLRSRAGAGDAQALAALRARGGQPGLAGNTLAGSAPASEAGGAQAPNGLRQDSVTKHGTLIYCAGATTIRDDGHKLKITRGATQAGLLLALDMAVSRYGRCLHVDGSTAFQDQVIQAAAAAHLAVTFDDAVLERRRQDLLRAVGTKEKQDEQTRQSRRGGQPGEGAARRAAGAGAGVAGARAATTAGRAGAGQRRGSHSQSDPGGVGGHPPPAARHRLRKLSQLGMVRIGSGTEVLLPRDVPGHMEQQGAAADQRVRRHVPGRGGVADKRDTGSAAVDAFLLEQEQTRPRLSDIPKFERYDCVKGPAVFAGLREAGGQVLALLERGAATMVLPVSGAAARRLRQLAPGDAVTVTLDGVIKTKGRTR